MSAIAGVKLRTGDMVYFAADGTVKTCNLAEAIEPVGIAAHDMQEGDVIEYSPLKNTKDIIIKRPGNES